MNNTSINIVNIDRYSEVSHHKKRISNRGLELHVVLSCLWSESKVVKSLKSDKYRTRIFYQNKYLVVSSYNFLEISSLYFLQESMFLEKKSLKIFEY